VGKKKKEGQGWRSKESKEEDRKRRRDGAKRRKDRRDEIRSRTENNATGNLRK